MRVLITGGTGFVGSRVAARLVLSGCQVSVLARGGSKQDALEGLPVRFHIGDVADPVAVLAAVRGQDAVIHAAADLAYWTADRHRQERTNVQGTATVARACREAGVPRMVHVSSIAAVGVSESPSPLNEDALFQLEGTPLAYHVSKHRAEAAVLAEVRAGLDAVIVNPGSIFGPYRKGYRGGDMIRKVGHSPVVPYFSGGICAVHVEDVVDGILAAMVRGARGERYILGGENLTYRSLAERAAGALARKCVLVRVPATVTFAAAALLEPLGKWRQQRPWMTRPVHYCSTRYHFYDWSKAVRVLAYRPRNFQAILEECVAWLHSLPQEALRHA